MLLKEYMIDKELVGKGKNSLLGAKVRVSFQSLFEFMGKEETILKNNGFEEFDKIETATSDRQTELRIQFGNKAKSKQAWFKSINHGEFLGRTWLKYLNQMEADSILRKEYEEIKTWIGNDIN